MLLKWPVEVRVTLKIEETKYDNMKRKYLRKKTGGK